MLARSIRRAAGVARPAAAAGEQPERVEGARLAEHVLKLAAQRVRRFERRASLHEGHQVAMQDAELHAGAGLSEACW